MVRHDLNRVAALLFTLIYLLFPIQALAAFQASVDRNPVTEGESFTLTLKSDEGLDEDPDLSELRQDFDVLGQSTGSNIQIINGRATRSVQWQISLMPKRSGPLVIPSIKAGGQATQAIVIGVNKADPAGAAQQGGELFLDVSAEPRSAFVQQQIIFIVRLYRMVNIGNESTLSDPQFPEMDAVVERLGEDRSYQTLHNGQAYAVIERRYAVFPQKSGQFNSAPVQFEGAIIEGNRGGGVFMFDPFGQSSRHKRVKSATISFTVKPAPAATGNTQWLPASNLQLAEQWSENPPTFTAGEPITRTLVVSAKGLPAAQLPVLDGLSPDHQAIDGFKIYPDQPVLKDDKGDTGISGTRTQKIALLPTRPGSFILPAIEVQWWNVNTDRMEVARLPAKAITVLPDSAKPDSASPGSTNPSPAQQGAAPPGKPAETREAAASASWLPGGLLDSNHPHGWWPWLSLLLGAGWLATFVLWWRARKTQPPAKSRPEDNGTSLQQLENQLKKGCLTDDAALAKAKLLAWAKVHWQQNPPTSLTAMAGRCQPALAGALNELDRALYARNKESWKGDNLWQLFNRYKPATAGAQPGNDDPLKPLFLTPP